MERDCFSEFQTPILVHAEIFGGTEKDTNTYAKQIILGQFNFQVREHTVSFSLVDQKGHLSNSTNNWLPIHSTIPCQLSNHIIESHPVTRRI